MGEEAARAVRAGSGREVDAEPRLEVADVDGGRGVLGRPGVRLLVARDEGRRRRLRLPRELVVGRDEAHGVKGQGRVVDEGVVGHGVQAHGAAGLPRSAGRLGSPGRRLRR